MNHKQAALIDFTKLLSPEDYPVVLSNLNLIDSFTIFELLSTPLLKDIVKIKITLLYYIIPKPKLIHIINSFPDIDPILTNSLRYIQTQTHARKEYSIQLSILDLLYDFPQHVSLFVRHITNNVKPNYLIKL